MVTYVKFFFVKMKSPTFLCNDEQCVRQDSCVKVKSAFAKTVFIKRKLANAKTFWYKEFLEDGVRGRGN